MKKIKKLAIYSTIGALAISNLTGCLGKGKDSDEEKAVAESQADETANRSSALEQLQEKVKKGDTKAFEPYEHIFYVRVRTIPNIVTGEAEKVSGGSINIPTGYQVLEIENFTVKTGNGSQTGGYDIWFTNEVPVEVTAIYNEKLEKYDFSVFGLPVEEKTNEETIQKTK